jgi:hypothetical protein
MIAPKTQKENAMEFVTKTTFKALLAACLSMLWIGLSHSGVGIGGTGNAFGVITDFGSIFVNGVEYSTSGANIVINGVPNRPEIELRRGMAVRVEGTINPGGTTGTATLVEFLGDIEGAIDAAPVISGSNGTFTIYGLVIRTDKNTVYDNVTNLAALQAGDIVEVSGLFNANDGTFAATRIEKQVLFRKVELRGLISNVNASATTFVVGPSLIVNYATATLRNFPAGGPASGMFVEVKADAVPAAGTLTATRVNHESSVLRSTDLPLGVVQGVAASVTSTSFTMGNQPIVVNAQTVFDGAPQTELTSSSRAIAAGPVVAGVLTASVVTIPVSVRKAWSRKSHGAAGDKDLRIDTNARVSDTNLTVEPRVIGAGHSIVFEFNGPVTSVGGVTVQDATGAALGTASFTIPLSPGNQVIATVTGVPDNKRAKVTLTGVNFAGNDVSVSIGFLVGDINNSHGISAGHLTSIKSRSGQLVDDSNFMFDLKGSGRVNAVDLSVIKARNGALLR